MQHILNYCSTNPTHPQLSFFTSHTLGLGSQGCYPGNLGRGFSRVHGFLQRDWGAGSLQKAVESPLQAGGKRLGEEI